MPVQYLLLGFGATAENREEQELSLLGLTFQEEGHEESPDFSLFCLLKRLHDSPFFLFLMLCQSSAFIVRLLH